jgi:ABC-type transporter Mla subunit MlaD
MTRHGVAIAAALGAAVLAVAGAAAKSAVPATAVAAEPARPAESGAHDSAATLGPLAIGATVTDRTGVEIGHVTRLTTDKQGRSVAEVRHDEDVYSIPVADLFSRHGAALSRISLEQLKRSGMAH